MQRWGLQILFKRKKSKMLNQVLLCKHKRKKSKKTYPKRKLSKQKQHKSPNKYQLRLLNKSLTRLLIRFQSKSKLRYQQNLPRPLLPRASLFPHKSLKSTRFLKLSPLNKMMNLSWQRILQNFIS